MSSFITNPNLPKTKVRKIICGTDDEKILSFFKREQIEVVTFNANPHIDSSIESHADISALHLGGNKIIIDKSQKMLFEKLSALGMDVYTTEKSIEGDYPCDIALNFAVFGEAAVGNFKYADKNLVEQLKNKKLIGVNQGYSKCSMLVINETAIITDDESIHKKMVSYGIESLLVSKGDIVLEGHTYGFIGGASFKISADTVVFFGDATAHRNYPDIKLFAEKYGCKVISTDDGCLRDIGGVVTLTEE